MVIYEVVMKSGSRVYNAFFLTLKDARRKYFEYVSVGWSGDIFRKEGF